METIELDPDPHLNFLLSHGFYLGISTEAILTLIILLLLLFFSGLVSGSETAFFSLQPGDLKKLGKKKGKKGIKVLSLRKNPKLLLATILISNNFINVGIVVISTYLTTLLFNFAQNPILTFLVQIIIVTSFLLIFGEILPKIYANNNPVKFSLFVVNLLEILIVLARPLSLILVKSTSLIDKKLEKKQDSANRSDLSRAIDLTVSGGTPQDEKMILKSLATFGEKEAKELMQSRVNVTAVEINTPFNKLIEIVIDSGYSRIPVFENTFDKIKGILYIKDLLPLIDANKNTSWQSLIRPAFFVPEYKKVNDLLQEFKQKKIHMAVLVDEYGGTTGIITLEDILEEIVGEINDEFDKEDETSNYTKLNDHTYVFNGQIMLNDLCKVLKIPDDFFDNEKGESDSLAGLILEKSGKIPDVGDVVNIKEFNFEVIDSDRRKIKKVKITLPIKNENN